MVRLCHSLTNTLLLVGTDMGYADMGRTGASALAHCPDGTFYYQPNRDNTLQDFYAAPRLSATAATALILTIKYKKLQMTGAKPITRVRPLPRTPASLTRAHADWTTA